MKYIIIPFFALLGFSFIFVFYFLGYLTSVLWQFNINPRYELAVGGSIIEKEIESELNLKSIKDLTWLLFIKYKAMVLIHNVNYYLS
tara:strand:+ start:828 stop:1088 length:261 start_codon:yes stop_codon:yes gene_type:complete